MSFPEQPFGFVAGRWVRSIGDTPDDADRAPDYIPVETGTVLFTPQITHRVAPDNTGWAGIIKERIPARLGERGQLIDAEGHDHLALAAGIYSVSYDFGSGRSWPSHYIEVRTEHTSSSPLWLPPIAPPAEGPMIENRVVSIPEGGRDGQVLVWDGAGFSWDYPPEGPRGPKGDLDAEQLAGAPRLTNLVHDTTWIAANASIDSQTAGAAKFTATAQNGNIRIPGTMAGGVINYVSAEVKTTSDQVYFGAGVAPVHHSGSGDWERLTGLVTVSTPTYLLVRDTRPSGWDQIEVRDPVLINLTAVFGAGREPTREYMDVLLAKHGHYIGGVDQFAFGDALKALTVAGPGMTLRRDTTVGTRVLLDHPGGTTMLMGDTGWRDLRPLINEGAVTSVTRLAIRRIGNLVHLSCRSLLPAPEGGALFPANVASSAWIGLSSEDRLITISPTAYLHVQAGGRRWVIASSSPTPASLSFEVTYLVDTAWPTDLIGTPL